MINVSVPLLITDRSLSALSDCLPQSVWRCIGLELSFSNDHISTVFERAEQLKSDPRFELLREWRNSRQANGQAVEELVCALIEIGRNDVAEMLMAVEKDQRELQRSDFGRGCADTSKNLPFVHRKRSGQFLYPDGL